MGFFDMLDPDERRARKEAKEEARDCRDEAKNTLSDARDVYDDYKDYRGMAHKAAEDLSNLISDYNKYKADVLKELSGNISVSINNFKNFNINSRVSVPNFRTGSAPTIPSVSVSSIMGSFPGGSFNPINIVLSVFSDPYKDRNEAARQLRAADRYLSKVQDALYKMKTLNSNLRSSVSSYIRSERDNLKELMDKLRQIVNQLNDAMNRNSFTEQEAHHMTAIANIAEKIKGSLEQQIVNGSGEIDSNFKLYSDRLREINNKIPVAPTISESSTWIEDIIVY